MMKRNEFIRTCSLFCAGFTGIGLLMEGCVAPIHFAVNETAKDKIAVKKTEFDNKDKKRKFVIVKNEKLSYPVYLSRTGDDIYKALSMECTHKSCELQPQGNYLVCPCHGSEFTREGKVQNPPAEQDLHTFKIITDNENIFILLT
jgi:cytochrome b6-f complex iron-sulfur subunit